MPGLRNICKIFGSMVVQDGNSKIRYIWDYARGIPVPEKEITKEQFAASEKAKWEMLKSLEQERER